MREDGIGCILVLFFAMVIILSLWDYNCSYADPHWETIVVKEKSIGVGDSKIYLVYTDKGVYAIQDLLLIGFFASSDVYNSIQEGETYRVKVYGKRIRFLSSYKNIVHVREEDKK